MTNSTTQGVGIKERLKDTQQRLKRVSKATVKSKALNALSLIFRYALLISLGFVIITPILNSLKMAITDQTMLGMKNSVWIPSAISDISFREAWILLDYPKALLFSMVNTGILMALQTLCASLAAYSFARLKFKGSYLLFGLVVFTIIVPSQSLMLAQYIEFRNFDIFGIFNLIAGESVNMIGSTVAIYLLAATGMGINGGLFIYILRQNFRNLPVQIEEAAFVDGAGFLRTFFRIVLPSASSALTTVGVLSFVWNYSDVYMMSLLSPTELHLPLKLMREQLNMRWALMVIVQYMPPEYIVNTDSPLVHIAVSSAMSLLVILPLMIIYLFVQRRFVQGVERSGLGGD